MPLKDIIFELDKQYCGTVGIEISHISNLEENQFLSKSIKSIYDAVDTQIQKQMYEELARSDALEKTLAAKYVGQKRFSIEGADAQICALESFMDAAALLGVKEFTLAMAHRGRLNVQVHCIKKPIKELFSLFSGRYPKSLQDNGDVKYHFGYASQRKTRSGKEIRISLSNNPSHLEFVDSVVLGETRAQQVLYHQSDSRSVCPILLHGDAAISGQGSVYETLAAMKIKGFDVGELSILLQIISLDTLQIPQIHDQPCIAQILLNIWNALFFTSMLMILMLCTKLWF